MPGIQTGCCAWTLARAHVNANSATVGLNISGYIYSNKVQPISRNSAILRLRVSSDTSK